MTNINTTNTVAIGAAAEAAHAAVKAAAEAATTASNTVYVLTESERGADWEDVIGVFRDPNEIKRFIVKYVRRHYDCAEYITRSGSTTWFRTTGYYPKEVKYTHREAELTEEYAALIQQREAEEAAEYAERAFCVVRHKAEGAAIAAARRSHRKA